MQDPGHGIDVTVILPVRNEADHITTILRDVLDQELGPLEIEVLVVDGDSDDATPNLARGIAARDPRVRVLHNPLRLSSGARALGAEGARGTFVAYIDGHCRLPSRTLLLDMVDLFERTGADCLARPQPLKNEKPSYRARAIATARSSRFGHSLRTTIYDDSERPVQAESAGAMYRRSVFARVGNFDTSFDACEDVEFNWRVDAAGLACWTSPKLAVAYEARGSLRGLFRQMQRYGLGRARLHTKHPEAFSLEALIPAAFTAGLPAAAVAPFLASPWSWIVGGPYLLYAALNLAASVQAAATSSWRLLPALPLAFLTIHTGLGWGYLQGLLTRRPPAKETDPPPVPETSTSEPDGTTSRNATR